MTVASEKSMPVIKKCERKNKYGKNCENTSLFVCSAFRNHDGVIIWWEIECPRCGCIWWIDARNSQSKPELYKKEKKSKIESPITKQ